MYIYIYVRTYIIHIFIFQNIYLQRTDDLQQTLDFYLSFYEKRLLGAAHFEIN